MKKFLILATALSVLQCATYRMSEQNQQEIKAAPHGMLSIKMPNGKQLDGYDEKWRLHIRIDKAEIVKDDFGDDELYTVPVKAGERDVNIQLKRGVLRPFRMSYHYDHGNAYLDEKKIKIEEGKTTQVTFEIPERKVSVGLIVLGVLFPIIPVIGWPIGDWPSSSSDMKSVMGAGAEPVKAQPGKKKGK